MGLNTATLRIDYLTVSEDKGRLVQQIVSRNKYEDDLIAPFLFSWYKMGSPYDFYTRVRQLYTDGNKRASFILDYQSLKEWPSKERPDFLTVIRDTILAFPEYNFYFDETRWDDYLFEHSSQVSSCYSASDYLKGYRAKWNAWDDYKEKINFRLHSFCFFKTPDEKVKWNPFREIIFGKDNLFDASNLRFVLKMHKLAELDLSSNFRDALASRAFNLALCVEEERGQNMFNSLSLYLNGFRVSPVTSAKELESLNKESEKPHLIIRDYDLQFPDAPKNVSKDIRDVRAFYLEAKEQGGEEVWKHSYSANNKYWSNLSEVPTFFVTKGFLDKHNNQRLFIKRPNSQSLKDTLKSMENKSCNSLKLPGITKPVTGIYASFQDITLVKERVTTIRKEEKKHPIRLRRNTADGHSVPLDLYSFVKSMVDRADKYYEEGRYIHSVIVANEAIEIINGFHQALSLRAYRRQALAENAVAANILGTSEHALAKDTEFRLKRIKEVITRLSSLGDYKRTKSKNTLNQIYNDIRIFCREKEHFEAESVVVRAIGHLNEGIF